MGSLRKDFACFMDDAIAAAPDRESRCGHMLPGPLGLARLVKGYALSSFTVLLVSRRELLQKLQAKLSNPLLKQPAPFEF